MYTVLFSLTPLRAAIGRVVRAPVTLVHRIDDQRYSYYFGKCDINYIELHYSDGLKLLLTID